MLFTEPGESIKYYEKLCLILSTRPWTSGTVSLNMDRPRLVNIIYLFIYFLLQEEKGRVLQRIHLDLRARLKKFCPMSEPIRLYDLQNSTCSCTEKKNYKILPCRNRWKGFRGLIARHVESTVNAFHWTQIECSFSGKSGQKHINLTR